MAGAFPSRPTRVTTLTSLSNFRARPCDSPRGKGETPLDSPSWDFLTAEGPQTPSNDPAFEHPGIDESALARTAFVADPTPAPGVVQLPPDGEATTPVRTFMGKQATEERREAPQGETNMSEQAGASREASGDLPSKPAGGELSGGRATREAASQLATPELPETPAVVTQHRRPSQNYRQESTDQRVEQAASGGPRRDIHTNGVSVKNKETSAKIFRSGGPETAAGEELVPLRTLLENLFPFHSPVVEPEVKDSYSDGVGEDRNDPLTEEGGERGGVVDVDVGTLGREGGAEPLAQEDKDWVDAVGAAGREDKVGEGAEGGVDVGLNEREVHTDPLAMEESAVGFLGRERNSEGIVGEVQPLVEYDGEGDFVHFPKEIGGEGVGSVKVEGSRGTSPPNDILKEVDLGAAESVKEIFDSLKLDSGEPSEKLDPEVLALLLREFLRKLGCESLISIQTLDGDVDTSCVAEKDCVVEGVVPGLGCVRLQRCSKLCPFPLDSPA
jgi:hypothetical protein